MLSPHILILRNMMSEKIQEVMSLAAYSYEKGSFTRRKLSFKLDTQAHDGFTKWLRNIVATPMRIAYCTTAPKRWLAIGSRLLARNRQETLSA